MIGRRGILAVQVSAVVGLWLARAKADDTITPGEIAELLQEIATLFGASEHLNITVRH